MIKLSIIIPVYNVEKYIKKCILSALNQDLNKNEYEIIVIDDETPDNSVLIINSLINKYPKQIRLFSQKNKGLGGARNTGINSAKGKYLLFLDADDHLIKNTLKPILKFALNNDLDILEFGANGVTLEGKIVYKKSKSSINILSGYNYLSQNQYMNSACNKLYSSHFLYKNNLLFKEQIFIEDFEFNTRAYYYAKRVLAIKNIITNFVQTSNSITRNQNIDTNKKMIFDIEKVIYLTNQFKNSIDKDHTDKVVINERINFLTVTLLFNIYKFNIDKEIRNHILNKLITKKFYPVVGKINDYKKNVFKKIVNIKFLYFAICDINNFLKKIN